MQCTSTVLMIRPASFKYNEQTAANNFFQQKDQPPSIQEQAVKEHDAMAELLRSNGVEVIVIVDTHSPVKPDALFPNNWFACSDKHITLFPMHAPNRRMERRQDIIDVIQHKTGTKMIHDLSAYEENSQFLEGTGSMVCDHVYKIVYACLSARTNEQLVKEYAVLIGYTYRIFIAADENGREIYHTNVMMCIGEKFAVLCADAITHSSEKQDIIQSMENTGHEVILISLQQMSCFAGNMLQVLNKDGEPLLVMSRTAALSLSGSQFTILKKYAKPLIADVSAIEKAGGGSVRCMLAEIFI